MVSMQARARLGVWSLLAALVAGCGGSEDEAAPTARRAAPEPLYDDLVVTELVPRLRL